MSRLCRVYLTPPSEARISLGWATRGFTFDLRWLFDLRYWRLCDLYSVIWLDKRLDLCDEIADAFSRFLRRPIFFSVSDRCFLVAESGVVLGDQNIWILLRRCSRGHSISSLLGAVSWEAPQAQKTTTL